MLSRALLPARAGHSLLRNARLIPRSRYSTAPPPEPEAPPEEPEEPVPTTRIPLAAATVVAGLLGAAAYSKYSSVEPEPVLSPLKVQRARIAHWKVWKAKRDAIEEKHAVLAAKELRDLERDHPGALERRKECEKRRQLDKEHEMKLMHDRHLSTEPGMATGKIPGWEDKQKARREHMKVFDEEMEALEKKLDENYPVRK
ncbi:hypothetical protein RQP46_005100 [Phenoliferia psychrophenolica]